MPIRLEYIVSNSKGVELKRFDSKSDAEAYDSVICAAEDISLLIQPVQKKLGLSEEQIDQVAEHLAFHADEVKNALKQIKKPKIVTPVSDTDSESVEDETGKSTVKPKAAAKKSAKKG